jgi:hypothetical protein
MSAIADLAAASATDDIGIDIAAIGRAVSISCLPSAVDRSARLEYTPAITSCDSAFRFLGGTAKLKAQVFSIIC